MNGFHFWGKLRPRSLIGITTLRGGLITASTLAGLFSLPVFAQKADPATPVVVQPGAPGQPTRTLPPSTRATLPPRSPKDVEFMQGMIMHHAQAVEMTALVASLGFIPHGCCHERGSRGATTISNCRDRRAHHIDVAHAANSADSLRLV